MYGRDRADPRRQEEAALSASPEVGGRLLGRAARVATVFGKYGLKASRDGSVEERARGLRNALEELGPTFAKLGQILSTRPDLVPPAVVAELEGLQDAVTPLTEAEVVGVMEEELGVPWEDVFASIEPEPLAAGTVAQVHRATLESGEHVVVKVQRPTARDEILRDLGLLKAFADKTEGRDTLRTIVDVPAVVQHLSESLVRELDFTLEGQNGIRMKKVLEPFSRLDVPGVYERLTTSRLLVLEFVPGVPVREAPQGEARREAAGQLLESFYRQILVEGFFHADPHPGNLRWHDDKIWFLDLGMVGELDPEVRELVLLLLLAFWQEDVEFLSEVMLQLAGNQPPPDLDFAAYQLELGELMAKYRNAKLSEIQLGPILQAVTEISGRHRVRTPASLALTGKALAQMQMAAAELDPTLDPFGVIGKFLAKNLIGRLRGGVDPKKMFYEAQKVRVRVTNLIEAFERVTGTRPGPKLQVDVRGLVPLEQTIRVASRRLALAITSGSALVAAGSTETANVAEWVPVTLGTVGGFLGLLLLIDLLRRR
ncbi:MAG: AarF/UbiB family protein [Actinomycetota bacterium]|nr:AarF/UbiB family protein [Actinomycetota bacterium]